MMRGTRKLIRIGGAGPWGGVLAQQRTANPSQAGSLDVPLHFRNGSTALMRDLGYGKNYSYDPDVAGGLDYSQSSFPDALGEKVYYRPVEQGAEIKIKEKLERIRALRKQAKKTKANLRRK